MTKEETRKEILELLARGKITMDEAVMLLDQTSAQPAGEDQPLKVDVDVDVEIEKEVVHKPDLDLEIEDIPMPAEKGAGKEPRWLRIHVSDLSTGKSKVNVNVPFGMVKFGLGVAQMFVPEEHSGTLNQIGSMMAEAEPCMLIDVQDMEDNEHVRIYFE